MGAAAAPGAQVHWLSLLALTSCTGSDPAPEPAADPDSPWLVEHTEYTPDTETELAAFLEAYGGRAVLGDQAVDAMTAYLYAEDALRAGDIASVAQLTEALWAQYPVADAPWAGTAWSAAGEHVGWPAAYYGLRMLSFTAAQGGEAVPGVEPIRLTAVLVGCAEGIQPTTTEQLLAGEGEQVQLQVDPTLIEQASPIFDQATRPFATWVQAITMGRLPVQVSVVSLPDLCLDFSVSESSGRYYAGPQDLDPVWSALPEEVVAQTNWWWVLHPSPVPEQFEDFATTEFITGGMGTHGTGAPLFISDDRWLLRKPPHMGQGDWWTVERRIYFNQWLQHEFMHHLFAAYPELGLEATSHQWFDRDTSPEDFEGVCEADYYAEAIDKRLLLASPSLAAQLRYGSLPEGYLAGLEVQDLVGSYQREPGENDWHMGEISQDGDALRWTNAAGVSWGLTADLDAGVLHTGSDCPYDADFLLVAGRSEETGEWTGELAGFLFNGELYAR